jgi:phage baseplate assembly protein W
MSTIKTPFSIATSGKISKETDLEKELGQKIRDYVLTQEFERPMNPAYGGNSQTLVFENYDLLVFSEYKRELHDGLLTNVSGVNIVDIRLVNPTSRGDIPDNTQMIEVLYVVPPNNEVTSAAFNLVSPLSLTEETNL